MYHLYHTPALVLGAETQGEGSRRFSLLTRELGLISASATSVREERSKLRYGLQNLSLSDLTLVRGKDSWRITSAVVSRNFFALFRATPEKTELFTRVAKLLRRLLHGEEKNERLFDAVVETLVYLHENAEPQPIEYVEIVLVLRILFLLGYLAPRKEFEDFLREPFSWNTELFGYARSLRALALSEINLSLRETQL